MTTLMFMVFVACSDFVVFEPAWPTIHFTFWTVKLVQGLTVFW